tara:strand:+ start:1666 stop:2508 length:843 start_codon:yes stop_codon:yes gene_type:complete
MQIIKQDTGICIFKKDKNNFLKFSPERGGIITDWISNNHRILYFDKKRFLDTNKSIRGGIPILFPICGNLEKKSLFGSKYLNLMQHGFARDLQWAYSLNKNKDCLNLKLADNEITRRYYPFSFEITIDCILEVSRLTFEIRILNKSLAKMPVNFGLHPYFNISDFKNIKLVNFSKNCLNQMNNCIEQTEEAFKNISKGIDLLMYSSGITSFKDFGLNRKITLINPYPFDLSIMWSDPPRKMLCMEPWTSPRNSFISKIRNIEIPSNSSQKLFSSIEINNF